MQNQDQVTLVNEQDEVIGTMDKIEAHRGDGKLHRAISVFLFRKNAAGEAEILIQRRSDKKIVGAGQWANTVCGNVWPYESYEECARRRLSFELGIDDVAIEDIQTFRYQVRCNEEFSENEIDHVFAGWFDDSVQPNVDEVADTEWILWNTIKSDDSRWTPWFKVFIAEGLVKTALEKYVS